MDTTNQTVPQKILKIKIQENTFEIPFPNVGQTIDIATRKIILSSGQYLNLEKNDPFTTKYIDVLATFTILLPELNSLLRVESLFDLDLIDLKELLDVYDKEYLPWYNSWKEFIKTK
jgi:archaellum component FlaF (FlaF/FlaG flagellin family)